VSITRAVWGVSNQRDSEHRLCSLLWNTTSPAGFRNSLVFGIRTVWVSAFRNSVSTDCSACCRTPLNCRTQDSVAVLTINAATEGTPNTTRIAGLISNNTSQYYNTASLHTLQPHLASCGHCQLTSAWRPHTHHTHRQPNQ
jgi:hypothetical protein